MPPSTHNLANIADPIRNGVLYPMMSPNRPAGTNVTRMPSIMRATPDGCAGAPGSEDVRVLICFLSVEPQRDPLLETINHPKLNVR